MYSEVTDGNCGLSDHVGFSEIPFLEGNYPQVSKKSIDVGVETSYFA